MRSSIACISTMLATALALSTASAQNKDAWFGVNLPQAIGDPHQPVIDVSKVKLAPARFPAGEGGENELSGKRIFADVKTIVGFSKQSHKKGDRVWGRVTGFPAAQATIEWAAAQFKSAGLHDVTVQEYAAAENQPMWWATQWEARLLADPKFGAASKDVVLTSAVPASGSMIEGGSLTGALVDVGAASEEKLPDVDVKGKIAVQRLHPAAGAFSERTRTVARAQELTKRGAIAVVNVVEQIGNMHVRDFGNCGAPCFNVGTADGAFIFAALSEATKTGTPLKLRMQLNAQKLAGLKGHNAFGVVPGKSQENIIVNAHADGWYDAAGDNADGLAVLVALARHFAKLKDKPDRTIVFVASGGHHSTGLTGPVNFVKMNSALTANTVLVLNLEHIAQLYIRPDPWRVEPTEQPMNFGVDNSAPFIYDIAKRGVERYGFNLNPQFGTSVSGDLGGYAPLGVARVQAIHSGPMYHTSGDVLETISVPGLERAARFYNYFLSEASRAARTDLNPRR